jgi:hypothetical protein
VLPGLVELLLQRFRMEHCTAIPLKHIRFLFGSLHDILHKATILTWVLVLLEFDYSRVQSCTFIYYSAWRLDSKLRATVTGSMRSLLEVQARRD